MTLDTTQEKKPSWVTELIADLTAALNPKPPASPQKTEPNTQSVVDLMNNPEAVHEIARQADRIAAEKNALYERQQHVINLAANIVGGTPARPLGLAGIRAEEIVELLMGLPQPQSLAVEKIICKLSDALMVNYQELGSSGAGFTRKPRVPAEYRAPIQIWVNDGKSLSAWFTQVGTDLGLGKSEDYNLTEFAKEA